jgi:hypothetical protein
MLIDSRSLHSRPRSGQ